MARRSYLLITLLALPLFGQDSAGFRRVSLAEASARTGPEFRPQLLGESVRVRGIIQAPLLEAPDAGYLAITDEETQSIGLLLVYSGDNKADSPPASTFRPGMIVEASGIVSLHADQPVVKPSDLEITGQTKVGPIQLVNPADAADFRFHGLRVEVQGEVASVREGSAGDLLEFNQGTQAIRLFLPLSGRRSDHPLSVYRSGDRIRATGIVTQFCLRPPYNQFFQLLLADPRDVQLVTPQSNVPPQILPVAVVLVLAAILFAWFTQQRSRQSSRDIARLLSASENLYDAPTAREAADILRNRFLEVTRATQVNVYHYDAAKKLLEKIPDPSSSALHNFHIEEASTPLERAIGLAVRNQTLLQFPNTRSAASLQGSQLDPQSLLIIPMRHQAEARGVIAVIGAPGRKLLPEPLIIAAQHLASDACHHFEAIELSAQREQTHRSEKLAVAGQLIHGVITELNAPLEKIQDLTAALSTYESEAIQAEVRKASETVKRIVAVARAEQIDARPVDLRLLFQRLVESYTGLLNEEGFEPELNLGSESLYVLGSADQLSRVFENLVLHANAAASHSLEHTFILSLNRIGRSAMIEIEFSGPFGEGEGPDFSSAALGLAITRGLLQSYGGELSFATIRPGRYRYDVELPSLSANPSEEFAAELPYASQRTTLTALLVEPDIQTQRRLLAIFGELNHRLIPVTNIEDAADLAEKLRFDIVLSSSRPEGGTWAELFQRIHHRCSHFALLSEDAGSEPADLLEGPASTLLRKPIEEEAIHHFLSQFQKGAKSV